MHKPTFPIANRDQVEMLTPVGHQNGLVPFCLATAMSRAQVYIFVIWSPNFHVSFLLFGLSETQDPVQRRLLLPLSIREKTIYWMVGDVPAKRDHLPADRESTPHFRRNQAVRRLKQEIHFLIIIPRCSALIRR